MSYRPQTVRQMQLSSCIHAVELCSKKKILPKAAYVSKGFQQTSFQDPVLSGARGAPVSQVRGWISEFVQKLSQSQNYVTTDCQSASLSWNKTHIWGLRVDFYYCKTVVGLLTWGSLSDERTGLSFTTALGSRQRSHFRFRVPWDSWPYFTVSDSRLPFSSPPTTRRVTVEVFDPASTQEFKSWDDDKTKGMAI
jgi:hypothetical protein